MQKGTFWTILIGVLSFSTGLMFSMWQITADEKEELNRRWKEEYTQLAENYGRCQARIIMDSLYYSSDTITITSVRESR